MLRVLTRFLGAALILTLAVPAMAQFTPVSLCDLKLDDDGDCVVDTPPQGDAVSVEGVVVAWKEFGVRGTGAIWDPTTDCCLAIFDITDAPDLPTGQWVRIDGWVGNFAGLAEIVDNPADGTQDPIVTDLGTNYGVVPPMEVVGADLLDFAPQAEAMESCLLQIEGQFNTTDVTFGGNTNYDFVAADGNTVIVRIDVDTNLVGTEVPLGPVTVVGILGQFNGFTDTCVGYQLLPRTVDDIFGSVATVESSWGAVKGSFADED
jgi:hypothetical protein